MRTLLAMVCALSATLTHAACPPQSELPDNTLCVEWQAVTEYINGNPIPATGAGALSAYRLLWATTGSFNIADSILINDPTATQLTAGTDQISIPAPANGGPVDVRLIMTALTNNGQESSYSNTVTKTINFPMPVPNAPVVMDAIFNVIFE